MRLRSLALTSAVFLGLGLAPARAGSADPLAALQWHLPKIKAPRAWTLSRGRGVTIAVVDTGIDLGHPDLAAKIVLGSGTSDTVDSDSDPQDENGHGTHVAGIAAAVTRNGKGVGGVAPRAKLLPVRVLDADGGGTASGVAAGIRFATRQGADIINLSLGVDGGIIGGLLGDGAQEVRDAVDEAVSQGVLVVVAAGNESDPSCNRAADNPKVLCVGAVDRNDRLSPFSNYDRDLESTYLVAPGGDGASCASDIYSTVLRSVTPGCGSKKGYDAFAGTSMAAPQVAGVAALLLADGLSVAQVISCLKTTSVDLGSPGRDGTFGYGRVHAYRALRRC